MCSIASDIIQGSKQIQQTSMYPNASKIKIKAL